MDIQSIFQAIKDHVNLTNLGLVLQLAILEGLLSFDNALALAALVSGRLKNTEDQKHALLWGIWGAYVVRIGIVFIGVWLMNHEWVKFAAGLYLIWIAFHELVLKKDEKGDEPLKTPEEALNGSSEAPRAPMKKVWQVIVAVELMDVMFSIDSVAVALAVSKETWVLIAGAVIGIMMMRVAASYFVKLIEKFPILVPTAFVLVGIAGIKVVLEVTHLEFGSKDIPMLGLHVPEYFFLPVMFGILIGAMVLNKMFPDKFR